MLLFLLRMPLSVMIAVICCTINADKIRNRSEFYSILGCTLCNTRTLSVALFCDRFTVITDKIMHVISSQADNSVTCDMLSILLNAFM